MASLPPRLVAPIGGAAGLGDRHASLHRFARELIALRTTHELSSERKFLTPNELLRLQQSQWNCISLDTPD
jgi:hypothetical protein